MIQFYDSLMTMLDTTGQKRLKSSQIDWVNYQRTQKEFWGYFNFDILSPGYFGREGHFKAFYHNLYATRDRAIELHAYLLLLQESIENKNGKK